MEYETLGKVAEIIMGQSPPGEMTNTDGYGLPLLNGPTEFGAHHPLPVQYTTEARKVASPGDLLFCVRGSTTGRMNWADRKYAIGRGIAAIRHRSSYELQPLVRAVIEYQLPELLNRATGSTFPNVSVSQLAELLYPTLDEAQQREIAHILGTLDDKIELNRRMNATLEAIARAIFKSWFVDFDPVHAKARGEQPFGMDADTAALFPDAFEDSELGPIPAGWRVTTLSKTVEVVKGRSYKSSEIEQSNVALVTLKSINRGGGYNPQGLKPYTGKYRPEQIVSPGEIVVAFTDITQQAEVIGKPALVRGHPDYDSLIASLDLGIVRPMIVGMNIPYLYELLSTDGFQAHVLSYVNGSTVLHLNNRGIPSYRYPLPTPAVLAKFEALAQPLFDRISANEAESRTLAELRDTLLPKLILGDIRIGECNDATSS